MAYNKFIKIFGVNPLQYNVYLYYVESFGWAFKENNSSGQLDKLIVYIPERLKTYSKERYIKEFMTKDALDCFINLQTMTPRADLELIKAIYPEYAIEKLDIDDKHLEYYRVIISKYKDIYISFRPDVKLGTVISVAKLEQIMPHQIQAKQLAIKRGGSIIRYNTQGEVFIPYNETTKESITIYDIIEATAELIILNTHRIVINGQDWVTLSSVQRVFKLINGMVITERDVTAHLPWMNLIRRPCDLMMNPNNKDIWNILYEDYIPQYEGKELFVDYDGNTYFHTSLGWLCIDIDTINSREFIASSAYKEYFMWKNLKEVTISR